MSKCGIPLLLTCLILLDTNRLPANACFLYHALCCLVVYFWDRRGLFSKVSELRARHTKSKPKVLLLTQLYLWCVVSHMLAYWLYGILTHINRRRKRRRRGQLWNYQTKPTRRCLHCVQDSGAESWWWIGHRWTLKRYWLAMIGETKIVSALRNSQLHSLIHDCT